jgi:hypothetical protein
LIPMDPMGFLWDFYGHLSFFFLEVPTI